MNTAINEDQLSAPGVHWAMPWCKQPTKTGAPIHALVVATMRDLRIDPFSGIF